MIDKPHVFMANKNSTIHAHHIIRQQQYQQNLLETLFELAPVVIALNDIDTGAFLDVNSTLLKPTGYSKQEFMALSYWDITPEKYKNVEVQALRDLKNTGRYGPFTKEYISKDGTHYPVSLKGVLIKDMNGKQLICSVIEDISERVKKEQELIYAQQRLSNILKGTHVGTWEWNIQTGETHFNQRWAEIIGYTLEELAPISIETWVKFVHPDDLAISNEKLTACFNRQSEFYECEARMKHRDGHWVWVYDRGKVFSWTDEGEPIMMFGTHQDISQQKQYEQELIKLSATDPLTGINNRRVFMESLEQEWKRSKRHQFNASILILDLDYFKKVNDTYGHKAGDDVLIHVGSILSDLRAQDIVARIGGEEFAVLLPQTELHEAKIIAERLRQTIEKKPIQYQNHTINLTTSIGISKLNDQIESAEKALHYADIALYGAKEQGRNCVVVYQK